MLLRRIFLAIFILLLTAGVSRANTSVTFEWDPNAEQDLAEYRLYQRSAAGSYDYNNPACTVPVGTETCTVPSVPDGEWFWVLRAVDQSGNESDNSNEVTATFDTTAPDAPSNLRITITVRVE